MQEGTWTIRPCPRGEVRSLASALDVSETTASVLVRRGYGDPEAARRFLVAELPGHDPYLLGAMRQAVDAVRAAITGGRRICVHGDYDVDGICATALAVEGLRALGADVEWHLPSRFEEGYGVSGETLARLADEGCGLLVTVDCGITSVAEVAEARARGLEVVVTDHHRPGETLPDCPVVAPRPSDYPFPELCGTGVVYKLLEALEARSSTAGSTSSRWRRSPTSSRSSTRTARSWPQAFAGSRGRPGRASAPSCASRTSTRPASTRARSASGSVRGSTRRVGSAIRAPRSSSCSPASRPRPSASRASSSG